MKRFVFIHVNVLSYW